MIQGHEEHTTMEILNYNLPNDRTIQRTGLCMSVKRSFTCERTSKPFASLECERLGQIFIRAVAISRLGC